MARTILLSLICLFFSATLLAQKPTCKSLQQGEFKVVDEHSGTTYIRRTETEQIEKNTDLGIEVIFSLKWIDECTYELRPKKLIKGDPAIMGDGTHFMRTRIKEITSNTYVAETSASFSPQTMNFVVEIIK